MTSYGELAVWSSPSLTYFVRDGIGLGGYVSYDYERERRSQVLRERSHDLGAGLHAVIELPLSARLGLLFRASAGYDHRWLEYSFSPVFSVGAPGRIQQQRTPHVSSSHFNGFEANLFVPLMFYASPSVGLGLGPFLDWQLFGPSPTTSQLRLGAGSWLTSSF